MKQAESVKSLISHAPLLRLNALDFSDLWDDEDLELDSLDEDSSRIPANQIAASPVPPPPLAPPPPPSAPPLPVSIGSPGPSSARTLRLHWRALMSLQPVPRVGRFGPQSIWAGLEPVHLDTNRLEYLFESKSSNSALCSLMERRRVRL